MQYQVQAPDGSMHVIDGPEGASPDQVIEQAKRLIPLDAGPEPTEGSVRFKTAAPGSPERVAALDQIAAETKAADRVKSVAEAGVDLPLLGKTSIPQAMGMAAPALAATVSGGGSIPANAGLAAAGGAAGTIVDEGLRTLAGLETPSAPDVAKRAAVEGGTQGALQAVGEGALKSVLAPGANAATRAVQAEGARLGIPMGPDQIISAMSPYNPLRLMAALVRGAGEDVRTLGGRLGTRAQEGVSHATRDAIQAATDRLGGGLPQAIEQPAVAGGVMQQGVEALSEAGRNVVRPIYEAAEQAAAQDPQAKIRPIHLEQIRNRWLNVLDRGAQASPTSRASSAELARIGEKLDTIKKPTPEPRPVYDARGSVIGMETPPIPENAPDGRMHYLDLARLRTELREGAFKTAEPGVAKADEAMLRELQQAVDRDIARVPNKEVVNLDRTARDAYRQFRVPFAKGEGRDLSSLVAGSPEDYFNKLTSPSGAQLIREIGEVNALHPGGIGDQALAQVASEIHNKIVQASIPAKEIPGYGRAIDGGLLRKNIDKYAASLEQLHGPSYVDMARDVAGGIQRAQQTPKGAFGRLLGGGLILASYLPAGLAAGAAHSLPVMIGVMGLSRLMETPLGMRYLAQGFFPQGARAAAGLLSNAAYNRLMKPALTDEEKAKVESTLPPITKAQLQANQQGPGGELPLARISKDQSPYDALIASSAQASGLSPQLYKAVLAQESGFNPKATSPKGAQGIAQVMPALAKDMGLKNPYDPTQAIPAGAQYLGLLMKKYGGDKEKMLAAYNAGPKRVDEAGGVPAIDETQKYVKSVLSREQDYNSERQAMMDKTENLSWPDIARQFQKAKRDPAEWSRLRRAVNMRIKNNLNKPTLGMAQQDYQRYLPIIVEALKPEAS